MGTFGSKPKSKSDYQRVETHKLKRDRHGRTEAMLWIEEHKTDPPIDLHHAPELQQNGGWTCAMYWVSYVKTDPPEWMHHNSTIRACWYRDYKRDVTDKTCAMLWITVVGTEPPEWMRHHLTFDDRNGRTLRDYWIAYIDNDPPEWMTITHKKKKESEDPNQT